MEASVYYKSPIGAIALHAIDDKIASVQFVNKEGSNKIDESSLVSHKPRVGVLRNCWDQLDAYFSGKAMQFDLVIDQPGSAFQQSVWSELCNIPAGKTISYLRLSKQLGNVKAIRAVGAANGKNAIAIIVPCHRVIGNNGSLVGYAGDLWRKQWLLNHEAKVVNGVQTLF